MEQTKKRTVPASRHSPDGDAEQRRRMGRVVHDERGNATLQWHDAPADYERPVFEVESNADRMRRLQHHLGTDTLSLESQQTFNPYSSPLPVERAVPKAASGGTSRTDLRKLSEWIKMMRELEERKQRSETTDNDDE